MSFLDSKTSKRLLKCPKCSVTVLSPPNYVINQGPPIKNVITAFICSLGCWYCFWIPHLLQKSKIEFHYECLVCHELLAIYDPVFDKLIILEETELKDELDKSKKNRKPSKKRPEDSKFSVNTDSDKIDIKKSDEQKIIETKSTQIDLTKYTDMAEFTVYNDSSRNQKTPAIETTELTKEYFQRLCKRHKQKHLEAKTSKDSEKEIFKNPDELKKIQLDTRTSKESDKEIFMNLDELKKKQLDTRTSKESDKQIFMSLNELKKKHLETRTSKESEKEILKNLDELKIELQESISDLNLNVRASLKQMRFSAGESYDKVKEIQNVVKLNEREIRNEIRINQRQIQNEIRINEVRIINDSFKSEIFQRNTSFSSINLSQSSFMDGLNDFKPKSTLENYHDDRFSLFEIEEVNLDDTEIEHERKIDETFEFLQENFDRCSYQMRMPNKENTEKDRIEENGVEKEVNNIKRMFNEISITRRINNENNEKESNYFLNRGSISDMDITIPNSSTMKGTLPFNNLKATKSDSDLSKTIKNIKNEPSIPRGPRKSIFTIIKPKKYENTLSNSAQSKFDNALSSNDQSKFENTLSNSAHTKFENILSSNAQANDDCMLSNLSNSTSNLKDIDQSSSTSSSLLTDVWAKYVSKFRKRSNMNMNQIIAERDDVITTLPSEIPSSLEECLVSLGIKKKKKTYFGVKGRLKKFFVK